MEIYYTVYKITNKINGRFYIGCHKTVDLNDGYMGSGKVLKRAIKKYGIENFEKEILHVFENPEKMFAMESILIEHISDENYNIKNGGNGGWDYVNSLKLNAGVNFINENGLNNKSDQYRIAADRIKNDPEYAEWFSDRIKLGLSKSTASFGNFRGKTHTEETKRKMSISAKNRLKDPTKNSQYGTMWITNGEDNRKIKKMDKIPNGWKRGRKL
jgi:hypothetical protein